MAEAIVNARMGDRWEAFSAGSRPTGYVQPLVEKTLSEIGIRHQGRSKSIEAYQGLSFDLVITLCDAADECPVWLGSGKKIHLPYPDPAEVNGNDDEKIAAFRVVRDRIILDMTRLLTNHCPG
jgi:arsenate reductase